jgi:hypothetical protein
MTCPLEDPCLSLYTLQDEGYKQNSLFGTITISSIACNLMIYVLILRAEPPQTVRPMYHHGTRGLCPYSAVIILVGSKEGV